MTPANDFFIEKFPSSLGGEDGFLGKHDRDFVADGINALAGVAFEAGLVREQVDRLFTYGADEDGKKVLGDRHGSLPDAKKDCSRVGAGGASPVPGANECYVTEKAQRLVQNGGAGTRGWARVILTRDGQRPLNLDLLRSAQQIPDTRSCEMKTFLTLLFATVVLAFSPRGLAQSLEEMRLKARAVEYDAKQEELLNIEKETARALQWNTGAFFRRVYGEDFVGILPGGQIMNKATWIAAVENSGVQYSSFIASDIRVRMFEETAVVTCLWSARGTKNGRAFTRQSRVTHVYVYGQRGWQAVASQETLLPG